MRILIFGGNGLVGSKFIDLFKDVLEIKAPRAKVIDILNKDQVSKTVEDFNPDSVINFAAYTNVEEAENQNRDTKGIAYQINVVGAKNVAEACKVADKHLIYISTEYVFDGTKEDCPYNEEDKPNPINWYGQTKYYGEQQVLASGTKFVIARISMPYSSFYAQKKDVVRFFLEKLQNKEEVRAIEDQKITPTLVDDISYALKTLIEENSEGIYHISAKDSTTPLDFVKTIIQTFGLDYSLVKPMKLKEYNQNKKAKLLKNSWLSPAKFAKEFGEEVLHTVDEEIILFKNQMQD